MVCIADLPIVGKGLHVILICNLYIIPWTSNLSEIVSYTYVVTKLILPILKMFLVCEQASEHLWLNLMVHQSHLIHCLSSLSNAGIVA